MIARKAFGGTLSTQAGVGVLAIGTTGSAILAYINIKRLRIDRHRAWMLRCWFYAGSIITLRIIMIIAVVIIGQIGLHYIAMPCRQIVGSGGNLEMHAASREDADGHAAVHANFLNPMGKEEAAAPFELSFGMALWLALMLHAVGVEVHLQLTTAETERLRQVSFERQIERGMRPTESASGKLEDRTASAFDHGNRVTSAHVVPGKAREIESTLHSDSASEVSKPAEALGWD